MKICFLLNHLNRGGITTYVRVLAELLSARGHQVWVASGGGSEEKIIGRFILGHWRLPVDTSSEANPKLVGAAIALRGHLKREKIQILHTQTRVAQAVAAVAAWGLPVRRVFTCHGYLTERRIRRALPLWGDRVIAISRAVERHLEMDWKVPSAKISRVWHGVRVDLGSWPAAVAHEEGEPVIGALGRYSPVKGFDLLVQAAGELKRRGIRFRLLLTGGGSEEKALHRLIDREDLEDRVRLCGHPAEGSPYTGIDIFCAPSRQEGFGFAVAEAMAAGKPVVATRVGGLADLVEEGSTGILVEPEPTSIADGLERLIGDPALWRRMGEAGQKRIQTVFTLDRMVDGTLAAYTAAGTDQDLAAGKVRVE